MTDYKLYYWPMIQGRGEFIRLALEYGGLPYQDVAREQGIQVMLDILRADPKTAAFAPPVLDDGEVRIGQTALILSHISPAAGLAPRLISQRQWVLQLDLTLADFLVEIHDTHHPISVALHYEDQRDESIRRSQSFRGERLPKFLSYFEGILAANKSRGNWLVGPRVTTADLSLFQTVCGLRYAFPSAMQTVMSGYRRIDALCESVASFSSITAYLASERRIAFNEKGIFRRYPELDKSTPQ